MARKYKSRSQRRMEADAIYYAILLVFLGYFMKRDWINEHKIAIYIGIVVLIVLVAVALIFRNKKHKESEYYKATNRSLREIGNDRGILGEYSVYKTLTKYEKQGAKFLFNCYLPKDNSDETTEIDVMMINQSGIFVFESKNYGGWIFGDESSEYWTQTLPAGCGKSQKDRFFNPIIQNREHVKWLKYQIDVAVPIHSIIVFSDHCEFKSVPRSGDDYNVVHMKHLDKLVDEFNEIGNAISGEQVKRIYEGLYPFSQVTEEVKQKHINNIYRKKQGEYE